MRLSQIARGGAPHRLITDPRFAPSIDQRLSASPTGNFKSVFSTYAPTIEGASVYNANLWGGGGADLHEQFTSVAWTATSGLGNPVAITPRHAIVSEHAANSNGATLTWITTGGSLVTRSIIDHVPNIGGIDDLQSLRLLLLSADLPSEIHLCPLIDMRLRLSMMGDPIVKLDAQHQALIAQVDFTQQLNISSIVPADATRQLYYENSVSGDSGSPVFAVLSDTLVYMSHLTTLVGVTHARGPWAVDLGADIQAAINSLNAEHSISDQPTFI